jgi:hypothetical protein
MSPTVLRALRKLAGGFAISALVFLILYFTVPH